MFHQANVIPTDITLDDGTVLEDTSTLEYWYKVVLEKMALYLNLLGTDPFPLKVGSPCASHDVQQTSMSECPLDEPAISLTTQQKHMFSSGSSRRHPTPLSLNGPPVRWFGVEKKHQ